MSIPRATELAHQWVRERVQPGDRVIDATAGNGYDTEFLAQLVGSEGSVRAFDIQPTAIAETRLRLQSAGLLDRVRLIEGGHETMLAELEEWRGKVSAIMFNLGYLPGSDKEVITQPPSTLQGLEQGLELLHPGGLITLVIYTGHEGGMTESATVLEFCHRLDPDRFRAFRADALNYRKPPPFAVGIERV